jgi:hypothetical protein
MSLFPPGRGRLADHIGYPSGALSCPLFHPVVTWFSGLSGAPVRVGVNCSYGAS